MNPVAETPLKAIGYPIVRERVGNPPPSRYAALQLTTESAVRVFPTS